MIVLYMEGGLGNQLFNYAAARALADHHGVGLVIDASHPELRVKRMTAPFQAIPSVG